MPEKLLLTCIECGKDFFTEGEKKYYEEHKLVLPKHCKSCRSARKSMYEKKKKQDEEKNWLEKENDEIVRYLAFLQYETKNLNEIFIDKPECTLYIIGNGFDLMHGVPSSYYKFRDSLGKSSELKRQLETWSLKEDLWSDLEDSLAHMDDEGMLAMAPDMLEIMGVLDEDDEEFSAADFFAAAEWTVYPLQIIQNELPKQFRKWINSLQPAEGVRPLTSLICGEGRYINFNYTEFIETIYGVKKENILYIHGDRRNRSQELILGHAPGAEDDPFYFRKSSKPQIYSQTSYDMYETASTYVADYYDITAKKSDKIIQGNKDYFEKLTDIEIIVVIGHSLSYVDYPYFREIIQKINGWKWNIGWHSSSDLKRIEKFVSTMGLQQEQIILFRT